MVHNEWIKLATAPQIGDRVQLIEDSKNIIYTIYSITEYKSHFAYTLWNWEDYTSVEDWQFHPYIQPQPIWINVSAEK